MKLEKEKYNQQKWDALLLRGWLLEKNIGWVCYHFFDGKPENALKELQALEIKRSFYKKSKNCNSIGFSVPVRAYIDKYCKPLSNKLWDGDPPLMYMLSLDDFKWNNLNHKINAIGINLKEKERRIRKQTRYISIAGGSLNDASRGWSVTK